jgi:CheY-like chemotaxis protein
VGEITVFRGGGVRLMAQPGPVYRNSNPEGGQFPPIFAAPVVGTLLEDRHAGRRGSSLQRGNVSKILVIEGEPRLRELYRQDLELDGYEIEACASVEEGLKSVAASRPNLIVLDVQMPGMDCPELLTRLAEDFPGMRILINAAYSMYVDDFLCRGADAYVTKSTNSRALRDAIRELLTSEAA